LLLRESSRRQRWEQHVHDASRCDIVKARCDGGPSEGAAPRFRRRSKEQVTLLPQTLGHTDGHTAARSHCCLSRLLYLHELGPAAGTKRPRGGAVKGRARTAACLFISCPLFVMPVTFDSCPLQIRSRTRHKDVKTKRATNRHDHQKVTKNRREQDVSRYRGYSRQGCMTGAC
jgi:hypothetical protein